MDVEGYASVGPLSVDPKCLLRPDHEEGGSLRAAPASSGSAFGVHQLLHEDPTAGPGPAARRAPAPARAPLVGGGVVQLRGDPESKDPSLAWALRARVREEGWQEQKDPPASGRSGPGGERGGAGP